MTADTDRLRIALRGVLCGHPTPGGPCYLRKGHAASHLPAPKRRARSANDEKEAGA